MPASVTGITQLRRPAPNERERHREQSDELRIRTGLAPITFDRRPARQRCGQGWTKAHSCSATALRAAVRRMRVTSRGSRVSSSSTTRTAVRRQPCVVLHTALPQTITCQTALSRCKTPRLQRCRRGECPRALSGSGRPLLRSVASSTHACGAVARRAIASRVGGEDAAGRVDARFRRSRGEPEIVVRVFIDGWQHRLSCDEA